MSVAKVRRMSAAKVRRISVAKVRRRKEYLSEAIFYLNHFRLWRQD